MMSTGERTSAAQQGTLLGQVVHGHEIVKLLGAGGMGEVYLARHQVLGVHRAIKVIHDDIKADATVAARFEREAVVLARLQHPCVVQVIDFGHLDNGWPFLCMEYVEGQDLDDRVERTGPLSLRDALSVLRQLAQVLEYVHGQGIVHRDLKPGNVLLRSGDPHRIAVIDFGLVRMVSSATLARLTAEQQMVGSPLYMAPEQAEGVADITGAADVYALAGIAYTLLSGKAVFPDRPLLALVYAHLEETPERLSARCRFTHIPPLLDALMFACLAKDPADRPAADELAAHLTNLAREAETDPRARENVALDHTMAAPDLAAAEPAPPPMRTAVGSAAAPRVEPAGPGVRDASPSVRISDSLASEVERLAGAAAAAPAGAAELLSAPVPAVDPSGVREAWTNQILAVIADIASVLAAREAAIHGRLAEIEALEGQLGDLEIDAALIDSQVGEAPAADRVELERRLAEAEARTHDLRRALEAARRDLVTLVERARPAAPAEAAPLFAELDDMIARARPVFAPAKEAP